MRSSFGRAVCAAGAAAVLFLSMSGCNRSPAPVKAAGSGLKSGKERKAAPDFTLKDADGRTVRLADYKGKVILLNFWATWCGPCKIEMPWFMEFERKYKDQGFNVVGVSMDEEGWTVVRPFILDMGVNYRILQGSDSIAQLYGGLDALPTTFLIDRDGKVAATHVGLAPKSDFENGIKELLEKTSAAGGSVLASAAGGAN
jgi:cytochrome c biogenesis protein CcmG/thiol:disulfide interchange protein DsbE